MNKEKNIAFIDGQNLHLGISSENWKIDFPKFRVYLRDKYKIDEAYYFLGFLSDDEQKLYTKIQKAGFILVFREHSSLLRGKKKGNVDVDIVFEIMKRIIDEKDFEKIVLVSGDGDYIKLVKYLIEKELLKKLLFPNNKYSSLYKQVETKYRDNLSLSHIKSKLEFVKIKEK
ncbi:MAG: NYN domain-containing protein [Candidatus Gracilibacteria bacterium]|nr:NYN domain-containing protein [Candidatus Gracilibacteria bacterium]